MRRGCAAERRRAGATTRRRLPEVLRAAWTRRSRACRSSSCSSTTARPTARRELLDRIAARDARVRVDPPVAQLRPPGGADRRARARARRRGRDDRRRPAGPAGADPRHDRAVEPGRRRRLRGAQRARGRDALQARDRAWFYKLFDKLAQVDLEPNSGDFRLLDRRALDALLAMTERSRFLRGMTVWVGFTQTRSPTSATRATPARRSTRCARCCASRSTRSRRSRTCRCSSRRCSGFLSAASRSSRSRS